MQTETDRGRGFRWVIGLIVLIAGAAFNRFLESVGAGLPWESLLLIAILGGLVFALYETGASRLRQLWSMRRLGVITCTLLMCAVVLLLGVRSLRKRPTEPKTGSQDGQFLNAPAVAAQRSQSQPAVPAGPSAVLRRPVPDDRPELVPPSSRPAHADGRASPVRGSEFDVLNPAAFDPDSPAVVIVDGNRHDGGLSAALASAVHGTDALFTADFLKSADFSRIRDGDVSMLRESDLARATSMLVIGSVSRFTKHDEVAGQQIYRTTANLTVRVFRPRGSPKIRTFADSGTGSGFDEKSSIAAADASAVRQVAAKLLVRRAGTINND